MRRVSSLAGVVEVERERRDETSDVCLVSYEAFRYDGGLACWLIEQ